MTAPSWTPGFLNHTPSALLYTGNPPMPNPLPSTVSPGSPPNPYIPSLARVSLPFHPPFLRPSSHPLSQSPACPTFFSGQLYPFISGGIFFRQQSHRERVFPAWNIHVNSAAAQCAYNPTGSVRRYIMTPGANPSPNPYTNHSKPDSAVCSTPALLAHRYRNKNGLQGNQYKYIYQISH